MAEPETPFNFGDTPENVTQERTQVPFPLDIESEASMTRSLPKIFREAGDLELDGNLTLKPLGETFANTGATSPSLNNEPGSDSPIVGGKPWTNPASAEVSDDADATADQSSEVKYHLWRGFNLLGSIPEGATILGIEVKAEGTISSGNGNVVMKLSKDGSVGVGNTKSTANVWDQTDSIDTQGDAQDLWGTTWSRGDFGVGFGVIIFGGATGVSYNLDHVTINVYFSTVGNHETKGNVLPDADDTYSLGSTTKRLSVVHTRRLSVERLTKLNLATTDVSLASTNAQVEIATVILPADTLGTNNGIYLRANFDTFLNGASSAHTMTFTIEYGTTELAIAAINPDNVVALEGWVEGYILASGATNTQDLWLQFYASENKKDGIATQIRVLVANVSGTATEDSTTPLVARLIATWSNSNASNTMQVRNSIIQIIN